MEASESITANDLYGKPIGIGTTVKYVSTRTVGRVVDIKREDDRTWALLDSTRLYYDTRYLEATTANAVVEDDEDTAHVDMEEVEKKIRTMEDALKVKDINMDTSCEGGG